MAEKAKKTDLKNMVMHSLYTFLRQVGVGLIGILSVVIIARVYGPEGNGIFALAMLLPTLLAMLLNLGMSAANVYLISSGMSHTREAILGNLVLSVILSSLGLTFGFLIITFFGETLFPGVRTNVLWLALSVFPLIMISGFLTSIFQGLQEFSTFNKILLIEPVAFFIGVLFVLAVNNTDLVLLIGLKLLASVIALVFTLYRVLQAWKEAESKPTAPLRFMKQAANYGFKANLGPITQFLNYKIDILILNFFTTVSITGVYVVAVSLTEKLFLISGAIATILFPKLSQLSSDESSKKELTPFVSRVVLLLTCVTSLALALLAYAIIKHLFGGAYLKGLFSLFILLPGVVIISTAKIWANDIASRGRPEINMYISMITLIFNAIGNIILIPRYGMNGAALTTSLAYILCSVITLKYYSELSDNSPTSIFAFQQSDLQRLKRVFKR